MDCRKPRQLQQVGLHVPGFRRDPRVIQSVLDRYIPIITVVGSAAVGLLAMFADLTGALGTGTGAGIVINGQMLIGDNSAGAEINRSNNFLHPEMSIEETLSIRGIKNLYIKETGITPGTCPEPDDIFKIGIKQKYGNAGAAIKVWETFGLVLGHTLANAIRNV